MENKKEGLSIPKLPKLDDPRVTAFLNGKTTPAEDDSTGKTAKQSNIHWTQEELELLNKGFKACIEKIPMYQYQKNAILAQAKKDIEQREKYDMILKDRI